MIFIKNKRIVPYEILIVAIFTTIICKKLVVPYWWYHAIIAYPVGMLYCQYENHINKYENTKYWRLVAISIFVFLDSTYFLSNGNYYLAFYKSIFVELVQIISFCFLMILIFKKYEINNKLFRMIGNVSYEIYLSQVLVFGISSLILNRTIGRIDSSYFLLSTILIVPVSYIFNIIDKKIISLLLNIKIKR
jgi:peptidoglycan/LPS O-acetylase OafA/YrhL